MDPTGQRESKAGQQGSGRGMEQLWEAQWQQFLKTLQSNNPAWGNPPVSEPTPWDDAKAFLASFEQVATACQWPKGEWVARLMPAVSKEVQQAFNLLQARDREDYGKVKAAILRDESLRREVQRQHFRQFCCQELEDPRRMYVQIQALCCQWLKPERHTKEQILELLVLEQFLASLPEEARRWIQAGGPDSCGEAVALLEDFLMSRREAEMGTWQPLKEWVVGVLDPKEEQLDKAQGLISKQDADAFKDTEQNVDGEVALPGIGIAHPTSLLPPEGEDMSEAEKNKALGIQVNQMMNLRKICLPLHMVEQTPMQSSQQTTFWKVLQEENENSDTLEDGKGNQLKVKNAQVRVNAPVETHRNGQREAQENALVRNEMKEKRHKFEIRQGIEPLTGCQESDELREGLGKACSNPVQVDTEGGTTLFSRNGRSYGRKVDEHHRNKMEVKRNDLVFEGRFPSNSSAKHHRIHIGEKKYRCTNCGKSFSQSSKLLSHERIHKGEKPHKCHECGKSFLWKSMLLRHEMVHTGEKPHKCAKCGRNFSQRAHLLHHESNHSGFEKPHKCHECGKSFLWKSMLLRHEMVHSAEKPHKCSECGKGFSYRSTLRTHHRLHTGEKPHRCPECGKNFCKRSSLLQHEMIHTGKNPPRSHLSSHLEVHTDSASVLSVVQAYHQSAPDNHVGP